MNITYMIGNGFDIALGLKTRYEDFISHYCSLDKSHNAALVRLQEEMRKTDGECRKLWSCAEKAFAEFKWSEFSRENTIGAFRDCLIDFQNELEKYLATEAERFSIPDGDGAKLAEELFSRMIRLDRYLSFGHKKRFVQMIDQGPHKLSFIVFNYTDFIERFCMQLPVNGEDGMRKIVLKGDKEIEVEVKMPCFVHGSLIRPPFMFGTDNVRQIKDPIIRAECERTGRMIKPYMDEEEAVGYENAARTILGQSDMVVTFGLSYGASDRTWWKYLNQHLFRNNKELVICPFYKEDRPVRHSADMTIDNKQDALHQMFASLGNDGDVVLNFHRGNIRKVTVLNDTPLSKHNGKDVRCDYLGLSTLSDAVIKDN